MKEAYELFLRWRNSIYVQFESRFEWVYLRFFGVPVIPGWATSDKDMLFTTIGDKTIITMIDEMKLLPHGGWLRRYENINDGVNPPTGDLVVGFKFDY